MWEIRLYDSELFQDGRAELMPLIKRVDEPPIINFLFAIEDKMYTLCAVSPKEKFVAVEEVDAIEKEPNMTYGEEFVCPYCKKIDEVAFELYESEGVTVCEECGSNIEYTIDMSVTYEVRPVSLGDITDL